LEDNSEERGEIFYQGSA